MSATANLRCVTSKKSEDFISRPYLQAVTTYWIQHRSKCPFDKPVTVVGLGYSLYDALATSFIHYDYTAFLTYRVVYTLKKRDDKKETGWTDKVDAVPNV
jgi:hypothetical protein